MDPLQDNTVFLLYTAYGKGGEEGQREWREEGVEQRDKGKEEREVT